VVADAWGLMAAQAKVVRIKVYFQNPKLGLAT